MKPTFDICVQLIAARYKWLLTAPPLCISKYIASGSFGGPAVRQVGREGAPEPSLLDGVAGAREEVSRTTDAGPALEWEPSDIKTGLSTFDNIFCRRCYVRLTLSSPQPACSSRNPLHVYQNGHRQVRVCFLQYIEPLNFAPRLLHAQAANGTDFDNKVYSPPF